MADYGALTSMMTRPPGGMRSLRVLLRVQTIAPRRLRPVLDVALAALATALAALVQYAVLPRPSVAPFVFFYLGIALTAWFAGRRAGLLTVVFSALVANWCFLPPLGAPSLGALELRATLLFVVGAGPIALLCGLFRKALLETHRTSLLLERQASLLARSVEAARESEERFRNLADAMPQLVWTARADGTIDYYNRRSAEFSGIQRRDDGSWTWAPVLHPDDLARTTAAWDRAVAAGEEYQIEHRVQLADGSFRWHLSRGVPVHDERGRVVKWYGTATDIHEQKRAQEALQEADRRKNEFLGVLSHELRNPLAPIRNSLHIAARTAPGSDPQRRALAVIERQVAQLTRLVDDLLDVTRIARGKIQLRRERVDLCALARQAYEDRRDLFERGGLELALDVPRDPVLVYADPARLAQVIGNLLQNAAKFSPRGSRATLGVRALDGRQAEITVEDTGMGIAPELLDRLFEPFVQAETALHRNAGGLGLGLALVKGLVELHGGTVQAHSAGPGTGARFAVSVPLERRKRPRPETAMPPAPARTGRRIVVIEDNQDAAETLKDALEMEGHEVAIAFDGLDGIRRARELHPDAIVCDIGLPGMDGFEVARALRADPELRAITLIALSGYALAEDVDRARAAGFDVHLPKPPDLGALEQSLAGARA